MASLHASVRSHSVHPSTGPGPHVFNPATFNPTHNPFLKSEPYAAALRPILQSGYLGIG